MATRFTVEGRITGDSSQLRRETDRARTSFQRFGDFLRDRLVLTVGDVTRALGSLVRGLRNQVSAALESNQALRDRNTALRETGNFTRALIADLDRQAESTQRLTTVTADEVVQLQQFLTELGVGGEKLGQATQASIDLSAALGLELESAARNVGRTVGGFAGELGELIPELRKLSAEQLRAGEGIDLLARKFKGRAQAAAESLRGELEQLRNELDDLGKNFVLGATEAEGFGGDLESATDAVRGSQDAARGLGRSLGDLVGFLRTSRLALGSLLGGFLALGLAINVPTTALVTLAAGLGTAAAAIGTLRNEQDRANRANREAARILRDTQLAALGMDEAMSSLTGASRRAADAVGDVGGAANDAAREAGESVSQFAQLNSVLEEIGVRTSLQVEAKILDLTLAFESQREALRQAFSPEEFARIEQRFNERVESMTERMERLKRGTDEAGDSVGDLGPAATVAAQGTDQLGASVERGGASFQRLDAGIDEATAGLDTFRRRVSETRATTALEFARIEQSAGRAAAVAAAVRGGGTLSQGGRRVRLPGGGSRLTFEPGQGGSTIDSGFPTGSF